MNEISIFCSSSWFTSGQFDNEYRDIIISEPRELSEECLLVQKKLNFETDIYDRKVFLQKYQFVFNKYFVFFRYFSISFFVFLIWNLFFCF